MKELAECPCVATGYDIYINELNKWLGSSPSPTLISLLYAWPCSDMKRLPSGLLKIQPSGQSILPQIQTICVREIWWSAMLSSTHWPNTKKTSPRWALLFFSGPSSSCSVSRCSGTLLARTLSFKTKRCPYHLPHDTLSPSRHISRLTAKEEYPANHHALCPEPPCPYSCRSTTAC